MSVPLPAVTVLMTVFDGARDLDAAIASVLQQDFHDFEFVIVDDGSRDDSRAILQHWARRDPRIVLELLPHNVGIAGALNHGLHRARGEFVALLDQDDRCLPGRLSRPLARLRQDPALVLVAVERAMMDARGGVYARLRSAHPPEVVVFLLGFVNAVGGNGQVMYRRDAVLALGGYRADPPCMEDYDLWVRLLARGRFAVIPHVGLHQREHPHRTTHRRAAMQRASSRAIAAAQLERWLGTPLDPREQEAVHAMWRPELGSDGVAVAERVLRRAYHEFEARHREAHLRRRARFALGYSWQAVAAAQLRRGALGATLRRVGYGLRWSVPGVGLALCDQVANVARRLALRLRRRERDPSAGVSDTPSAPKA
jgi:glycosyltransferase involved in cell wall biosynthesis